jgi:hypothetical protein
MTIFPFTPPISLLEGNSLIAPAQRRLNREHENIGCETKLGLLGRPSPQKLLENTKARDVLYKNSYS